MTTSPAPVPKAPASPRRGLIAAVCLGAVVLGGIALDTTVVHIGSESDVRQQAFAPDTYGQTEFPRIQAVVEERAVDGVTIAPEVMADKVAAAQKYGTASSTGAIMMVRVTGVVGEGKSGVYTLAVEGCPPISASGSRPAPPSTALTCAMRPAISPSAPSRTRSNIRMPDRPSTAP
ncbi:DUF2291 family protein [Gemmobacter lanyuensis]